MSVSVPVLKAAPEAGRLWVCGVGWLVVPEVFPDSGSTLLLQAVHGSRVLSPAMEQMALASWYTLQASLPCPERRTVFNVALSVWVACGSLHDGIVNYVMHPKSPESTCLTEPTVSLCSCKLSGSTLFWSLHVQLGPGQQARLTVA